MSVTSLQFGPEWMRNKQPATPATRPPASVHSGMAGTSPGASSYSSLLSAVPPVPQEKQDAVNPFRYSKEDMLEVWREGGGRGVLGLEVELWEGVIRESGGEPLGLKEMTEAEKRLFSHSINSDLRRRQSHDFLPGSAERLKLSHSTSNTHGPLGQSRYSALLARKRKEDGTDTGPPISLPRRLSLTSLASPLGTPLSPSGGGLPSPRTRLVNSPHGFDNPATTGDGNWRKRDTNPIRVEGTLEEECDEQAEKQKDLSGVGSYDSSDLSQSVSARSMAPSPPSFRDDSGGGGRSGPEDLTAAMTVLSVLDEESRPDNISTNSLNGDNLGSSVYPSGVSAARPSGIEDDPSNISWSYRDPKGNIQGPFPATLMQKWYDEGYFTPDLLMKRTHLDSDWTAVGELSRRAGSEKLFFSSFSNPGPPGLTALPAGTFLGNQALDRFGQPLLQNIPLQHMHQGQENFVNGAAFRHPIAATTRTVGFDAYLGSSSNVSQSPILSNFNANPMGGVSTASPDLAFGRPIYTPPDGTDAAFGGRVNAYDQQPGIAPRASYNAPNDPPLGSRLTTLGQRGSVFEGQAFNNVPVSRWGAHNNSNIQRTDEYDLGIVPVQRATLNGVYGGSALPHLGSQDSIGVTPDVYGVHNAGFSHSAQGVESSVFGAIGSGSGQGDEINVRHGFDEHSNIQASFGSGYGSVAPGPPSNQTLPQPLVSQHIPQQLPQHQQHPVHFQTTNNVPGSALHAVTSQRPTDQLTSQVSNGPWGTSQPAQPHSRPFDASQPIEHDTVTTPSNNDAVAVIGKLQVQSEPTEWYNSSKPEDEVGVTAPSSQEQQTAWNMPPQITPVVAEPVPLQANKTVATVTPESTQQPVAKRRTTATQSAATKPAVVPPVQSMAGHVIPSASPSAPTPAKPAWGTAINLDEEKTTKTGLREIQEAEAKKAGIKKQAERERERVTHTIPQEEVQTFTASWGLPTSQAGATRTASKEQAPVIAPSQPTALPVWTNAVKPPPAKTMKEIQEEEESRKRAVAREKESAAITARRGYADSANKVASNQPSGGAWSTVGAGGKVTAVTTPSRQASGNIATTSQAGTRPANVTASTRPGTSSSVASAAPATKSAMVSSKPTASPVEEGPVAPSPEFMKWLREAVRGCNAGVNTEDFMAMLLQFSLDFPPSTVEVIQDMVYMNSTTMDGRRFAAEFCSRRKADAANRPKLAATGKQPSLADVVKTQPKPTHNELPFKMVKKKGRGNTLR